MKYTTITAAALTAALLLPSLAEAQNALQKGLKFLNSVSDSLNQASGSPQGQQPQAQSPSPFAAPAAADADDDAVPAAGAGSLSLGGKPAKDEANDDDDDEPKASSGTISFGKPKAEAAETVEVMAKGQGESVEAAKKDAVRNAIKQAVGELVGAKTLVENDELVEDKILTLSNAMVENAFYGDAKSIGDGLFEVPVKAVVKKGKLNQELEKIGVTKGAVKGDSLAAKLFSGRERVANAEKFLAERFKDFPGNVVEGVMLAKADDTPDIEVDDKTGHVFANVGLRVNMENYLKWTQALCELLGAMCIEQEKVNIPFEDNNGVISGNSEQIKALNSKIPLKQIPPQKTYGVTETETGRPLKDPLPVIVFTPSVKGAKRPSWPATIYYLDSKMFSAFCKQLVLRFSNDESGVVEVALKDEEDTPVCSGKGGLDVKSSKLKWGQWSLRSGLMPVSMSCYKGFSYHHVVVAPVLTMYVIEHGQSFDFLRSASLTHKMRLDLGKVEEDDLAEIKGYEVKVTYPTPQAKADEEE